MVCSSSRRTIANGLTRTTSNLHNGTLTETREGAIITTVHRFTLLLAIEKTKIPRRGLPEPRRFCYYTDTTPGDVVYRENGDRQHVYAAAFSWYRNQPHREPSPYALNRESPTAGRRRTREGQKDRGPVKATLQLFCHSYYFQLQNVTKKGPPDGGPLSFLRDKESEINADSAVISPGRTRRGLASVRTPLHPHGRKRRNIPGNTRGRYHSACG